MFYFQLVIMAGTVLLAYYFEFTDTFPVHIQGFFCNDKTFSKPYPGPDHTSKIPPVLIYSLVTAIPTFTVRVFLIEEEWVRKAKSASVGVLLLRKDEGFFLSLSIVIFGRIVSMNYFWFWLHYRYSRVSRLVNCMEVTPSPSTLTSRCVCVCACVHACAHINGKWLACCCRKEADSGTHHKRMKKNERES